jgi:hypothetical protein
VVLGVTPFIVTVPKTEPDFYRVFIFRLAGHHPATVQTNVTTAKVTVKATLEAKVDGKDDAEELARLRAMAKKVTGNREPLPARALAPVAHGKELAVEVPGVSPAVVEEVVEAAPEALPSAAPAAVVAAAPAPPEVVAAVVAPKPAAVEPPAPAAPEEPKASAPAPSEAPAASAAPAPAPTLEPKKVPAHVLEKNLLSRVTPKLPPRSRAAPGRAAPRSPSSAWAPMVASTRAHQAGVGGTGDRGGSDERAGPVAIPGLGGPAVRTGAAADRRG